jgi:hypothetical protein
MHIPAYQIHNVLNTYSQQLFKAGITTQDPDSGADPSAGRMTNETRRKAVIDKVAADIVQRITRLDGLTARESPPSPVSAGRTDFQHSEIRDNQFVFNTLDIHNNKTSRTLSIEDSIFFIKRDPPE